MLGMACTIKSDNNEIRMSVIRETFVVIVLNDDPAIISLLDPSRLKIMVN